MQSPFVKLLADLVEADISFVTVGGLACAFNGHVRVTEDVDILVQRSVNNVETLLYSLLAFGEGHARELVYADFADEEGAIRIVEDFPLDVFVRMGGRSYEDLACHIRHWSLGELMIPYLDIDGLLLLKGESLRQKDKLDVLALTALRGE